MTYGWPIIKKETTTNYRQSRCKSLIYKKNQDHYYRKKKIFYQIKKINVLIMSNNGGQPIYQLANLYCNIDLHTYNQQYLF